MSKVALGLWLVVLWVLLWGNISVAKAVTGIGLVLVLFFVFPSKRPTFPLTVFRPIAIIRLGVAFVWGLFVANIQMARLAIDPRRIGKSAVVELSLRSTNRQVLMVVATMTALTPGSLVMKVRQQQPIILLHIFTPGEIQGVIDSVHHIEDLAIAAFSVAEDRVELPEGPEPRGVRYFAHSTSTVRGEH